MNYIGSKLSLLGFIQEVFQREVPKADSITDLFAGTHSVGRHFKKQGFQVTGNDLQEYSYALGKHYLENNDPDVLDYSYFDKLNSAQGQEGFVYNNYAAGSGSGRMYFSDHNALHIDAARTMLEDDYTSGKIDTQNYYFYLASLLESVDKYANTASVYGAFLKKLKSSAQRDLVIAPCEVISSTRHNVSLCGDANEVVKTTTGDVLYLDPPYNSRQYSSNYHLLETITKYDNPEIKGKTGLRVDDKDMRSDYSKKKDAESALRRLIEDAQYDTILLSYNNEGIIPLEQVESIFSDNGKYTQYKTEYKRFKSQNNVDTRKVFEYLHVVHK